MRDFVTSSTFLCRREVDEVRLPVICRNGGRWDLIPESIKLIFSLHHDTAITIVFVWCSFCCMFSATRMWLTASFENSSQHAHWYFRKVAWSNRLILRSWTDARKHVENFYVLSCLSSRILLFFAMSQQSPSPRKNNIRYVCVCVALWKTHGVFPTSWGNLVVPSEAEATCPVGLCVHSVIVASFLAVFCTISVLRLARRRRWPPGMGTFRRVCLFRFLCRNDACSKNRRGLSE